MKQVIVSIFAVALSLLSFGQKASAIEGIWWNEEKDARVEIVDENGVYIGKIIWLNEPMENGKPKVDDENPDASKQNRPLMNLLILEKLKFDGELWDDGTIYDPKSGSTYDCYAELMSENRLKLRGYIGFSLLGRSAYWERYQP
jgi:uncharacterized protein (DUF2147 family)